MAKLESFPQAPDDEFRSDEVSVAGLVGFFFPFSRFLVRPLLHDERVDIAVLDDLALEADRFGLLDFERAV